MKIAVVGGGILGLTAGYQLTKKGHQVAIFEKESRLGGLLAGFQEKGWDWHLDYLFHHLFTSDREVVKLINEVGLGTKLLWLEPKSSILYQGQIDRFDSPASVLRFPHLNPVDKLRVSAATAFLKIWPWGTVFRKQKAQPFLRLLYGPKSHRLLWQPLLEAKFGSLANQISMVWFWARIKKRSAKLGYLQGGFQILINCLAELIRKQGGQIRTGQAIDQIVRQKSGQLSLQGEKFDRVLVTTPTSIFLEMAPPLPTDYRKQLSQLKMIGALNLALAVDRPLLTDQTYWLNVNEANFPFVAVVEQTNLVPAAHYHGQHLVYLGGYYPPNHPYLKMNKEDLWRIFQPFLAKINPEAKVTSSWLFTSRYAQPIVEPGYDQLLPSFTTPISHLFLANMEQAYPWDRGVNYSVKLGKEVARLITK